MAVHRVISIEKQKVNKHLHPEFAAEVLAPFVSSSSTHNFLYSKEQSRKFIITFGIANSNLSAFSCGQV